MNKRLFVSLLLIGIAVVAVEKAAAQAVTIGGELRTRTEVRSGAVTPLYDSLGTALVTVMRSRLNMAYTSNVMKAKLVLQDTHGCLFIDGCILCILFSKTSMVAICSCYSSLWDDYQSCSTGYTKRL